jgi:hypothetical protein
MRGCIKSSESVVGKYRIGMDVAVSRCNTLYYDRTLLNCLNRTKEKPQDSWYLCRESTCEPSECNTEAIPLGQTCWYR